MPGAFGKILGGKEYKEFRDSLLREVSLSIIAQTENTKDRNKRILGARANSLKGRQLDRYLDAAIGVIRSCEIARNTTYRTLFQKIDRLLKHYHNEGNYAKIDKLKTQLTSIGTTYTAYAIIEETAYWNYDEVYRQTEVLAAMGFHPPGEDDLPERDKSGHYPRRIAADTRREDTERKKYHAAQDRAKARGMVDDKSKSRVPEFSDFYREATKELTEATESESEVDKLVKETLGAKSPKKKNKEASDE